MQFRAVPAIISSVIIIVGVIFISVTVAHSAFSWRIAKNKADRNVPVFGAGGSNAPYGGLGGGSTPYTGISRNLNRSELSTLVWLDEDTRTRSRKQQTISAPTRSGTTPSTRSNKKLDHSQRPLSPEMSHYGAPYRPWYTNTSNDHHFGGQSTA